MKRDGVTYVSCSCDCGNTGYITRLEALQSGNTKSCGCKHAPSLIGMKFGRLTVLEQIDSKTPQRRWLCQCECGTYTEAISYHLTSGQVKSCGCLRSERNSHAEIFVRTLLEDHGIDYFAEHTFEDCIGINGRRVRFDFFIPEYNLAIECDGKQHFKPIKFFGGEESFITLTANDNIKNIYCLEHKIYLLRLPYTYTDDEIKHAILQLLTYENPVTTTV